MLIIPPESSWLSLATWVMGSVLDLSQLLQIHFTPCFMPPQAHLLSLLQPRFCRRHQQATQEQRANTGEEPAHIHPHCQGTANWLCLSLRHSSLMVMPCVVISPPRQHSTFCFPSLLCCSLFVKSPFITPFSSVSCRNLDRYGCFFNGQGASCQFSVYHLWGSMWRVWHRRFKLLFVKGLFDRQDHLGRPRLKALPWIRCFHLLTYLFIQKYLPRTYCELDMVPDTGDAAVNRLD